MDINQIKKLIKVIETSEITEFSIQDGDLKIKISKNSNNQFSYQMPVHSSQMPQKEVETVKPVEPSGEQEEATANKNLHEIRSPIVGTFYRAPAPDADPYSQVGDTITAGSVLCIVEAMKLMNEIESDVDGKIVKILVENATPVEYNQPIFLIEKT